MIFRILLECGMSYISPVICQFFNYLMIDNDHKQVYTSVHENCTQNFQKLMTYCNNRTDFLWMTWTPHSRPELFLLQSPVLNNIFCRILQISMLHIPRELFLLHAIVSHTLFYLFSAFREREKDYLLFFLAEEIGNFC